MGPLDNSYSNFDKLLKELAPYYPIILIISGLLLAIFIDFLIKRYKNYIIKNKIVKEYQTYKQIPFVWQSLKILFSSIRGYVFFWIFVLSVYSAVLLSFNPQGTDLYYLDSFV